MSATVQEIMASLQVRYIALNRHYEAGWTDSWSHRRCEHAHQTLIEAAKCAQPRGCGWYVFCVEYGTARQLTDDEERRVNEFRFGGLS
jgi:sugar phosphate isomerase/epimerase